MSKDFEVYCLLQQYLKTDDQEVLLLLYNLIHKDLVKVLYYPLNFAGGNIKMQRRGKLKQTKGDWTKVLDRIRQRFIEDECFGINNCNPGQKLLLLLPFWKSIRKISLENMKEQMILWGIGPITYLQTMLCDYYWLYIQKYIHQHFYSSRITSITSLDELDNPNGVVDKYYYFNKNSLYSNSFENPEHAAEAKYFIAKFKQHLSPTERKVFTLLLRDLSHKDIAKTVGISENDSKNYKQRIRKKYHKYKVSW